MNILFSKELRDYPKIHGKEDKLISNTNENGCLCTTETLLSSTCYHSCKPGTETALCDLCEQSCSTGHGSQLALRSIINGKSLQVICWLKYVHVKHLSKKFEYSQMWKKKKSKPVSILLWKWKKCWWQGEGNGSPEERESCKIEAWQTPLSHLLSWRNYSRTTATAWCALNCIAWE